MPDGRADLVSSRPSAQPSAQAEPSRGPPPPRKILTALKRCQKLLNIHRSLVFKATLGLRKIFSLAEGSFRSKRSYT